MNEVEDIRAQRLSNAQCRQLHEDVDHLLLLGHLSDATDVVVSKERITLPTGVAETQADVVAERDVAQQKLEVGSHGAMVNIVGTLPSQHMLGTLGKHALEAHLGCLHTNIVAVDKRRVAQHGRLLAKYSLIFLHCFFTSAAKHSSSLSELKP